MRSLRDRLQSYKKEIVKSAVAERIEEVVEGEKLPETAIEAVVPGTVEVTPFGECFYREVRVDVLTMHGYYPLARTKRLGVDVLQKVCKVKADVPQEWERVCFFDTETTGLGSGAGNFIFLFGVGFFDEDEFVVRQYFLRSYAEERAFLYAIGRVLERFEAAVSFNGKGFDWKLLETRMTLGRMELPGMVHLDLLPPARRLWKKVLANCKLMTLEQEVLGFSRLEDTPGKLAPELYFAYQTDGDARPMAGMFRHNLHDIWTLVTLAWHIGQMVEQPLTAAVHPEELFGLARWYEEWAQREVHEACLVRIAEMDEGLGYAHEAAWKLSLLYKRVGRLEQAVELWQKLLEGGGMWQTVPRIELAKYFEHRVHDYRTALRLTEETMEVLERKRTMLRSLSMEHEWQELLHRRERLLRKCQREVGVQG
jgi:uncharacterized protein YprB with RNaseH-like and TPR domain